MSAQNTEPSAQHHSEPWRSGLGPIVLPPSKRRKRRVVRPDNFLLGHTARSVIAWEQDDGSTVFPEDDTSCKGLDKPLRGDNDDLCNEDSTFVDSAFHQKDFWNASTVQSNSRERRAQLFAQPSEIEPVWRVRKVAIPPHEPKGAYGISSASIKRCMREAMATTCKATALPPVTIPKVLSRKALSSAMFMEGAPAKSVTFDPPLQGCAKYFMLRTNSYRWKHCEVLRFDHESRMYAIRWADRRGGEKLVGICAVALSRTQEGIDQLMNSVTRSTRIRDKLISSLEEEMFVSAQQVPCTPHTTDVALPMYFWARVPVPPENSQPTTNYWEKRELAIGSLDSLWDEVHDIRVQSQARCDMRKFALREYPESFSRRMDTKVQVPLPCKFIQVFARCSLDANDTLHMPMPLPRTPTSLTNLACKLLFHIVKARSVFRTQWPAAIAEMYPATAQTWAHAVTFRMEAALHRALLQAAREFVAYIKRERIFRISVIVEHGEHLFDGVLEVCTERCFRSSLLEEIRDAAMPEVSSPRNESPRSPTARAANLLS